VGAACAASRHVAQVVACCTSIAGCGFPRKPSTARMAVVGRQTVDGKLTFAVEPRLLRQFWSCRIHRPASLHAKSIAHPATQRLRLHVALPPMISWSVTAARQGLVDRLKLPRCFPSVLGRRAVRASPRSKERCSEYRCADPRARPFFARRQCTSSCAFSPSSSPLFRRRSCRSIAATARNRLPVPRLHGPVTFGSRSAGAVVHQMTKAARHRNGTARTSDYLEFGFQTIGGANSSRSPRQSSRVRHWGGPVPLRAQAGVGSNEREVRRPTIRLTQTELQSGLDAIGGSNLIASAGDGLLEFEACSHVSSRCRGIHSFTVTHIEHRRSAARLKHRTALAPASAVRRQMMTSRLLRRTWRRLSHNLTLSSTPVVQREPRPFELHPRRTKTRAEFVPSAACVSRSGTSHTCPSARETDLWE
jgi:hypothetical protein